MIARDRERDHGLPLEKKLALGPIPSHRHPTQHPQLSPPRRRRCAQVRERCMSVATISHAPQLFLRARVDQHPTHHPPPLQTCLSALVKCQGPRARPDDPRPHAHVRRAAHRGARARRARRVDLRRRRSALAPGQRRRRVPISRTPLWAMSRVTPFAHTPTPAGQIRAPARRPCWARDRLGRATVAFVSGREAERLGMKQLLSLCLFVRFSLFLRRPLGTRAHMTDQKSACLWARHTSSNPGRGNHRTPPRALRLVSGFSEKSTQMTCQKSSTILRNIQPL